MALSLAGCGAEGGTDRSGNPGSGGGSASTGGSSNGSGPPPGVSADGWQSEYVDGGVGTNCNQTFAEMDSGGVPRVTVGDTTIFVGFEQNGNNQNPVFARFDNGQQVYCEHHEGEAPDGRAVGITWDGGNNAYVVYTVVGGGTALEAAATSGWLNAYAPGAISGGGPKVSFVGQVEVTYGTLQTGTFVIAVKSDNKVNSHGPRGPVTVLENGNVEFLGGSAHKPIDVDKQPMDCTDYPFESRYVFVADLSDVVCADCTNCAAERPCP